MEYPQYVIKQSMKRVLVPLALRLVILTAVFYAAIVVNLFLAVKYRMIRTEINTLGYIGIAVFLLLLVALELVLEYKKAGRLEYVFYSNRFEYGVKNPKIVYYTQILNPEIKRRGIFDRIFNTAAIKLTDEAKIEKIENFSQVFMYIQQLKQAVMRYGYGVR